MTNEKRPWVILGLFAVSLITIILTVTLLCDICIPEHQPVVPDHAQDYLNSLTELIVAETNHQRVLHGVPTLTSDTNLTSIAQAYSDDQATRRYTGHYNPEGLHFGDRAVDVCRVGAENLYYNSNITWDGADTIYYSVRIVDSWLNSPGHRESLLKENYTHIGVGAAVDITGKVYVVQVFCDMV